MQQEIACRTRETQAVRGASVFAGRIRCGICGGVYRPKIWHSHDHYRKVVWQCNDKYASRGKPCKAPHLSESDLKALFVRALNKLIADKARVIRASAGAQGAFDTTRDEERLEQLRCTMAQASAQAGQLVTESAMAMGDRDACATRLQQLSDRHADLSAQAKDLEETIRTKHANRTKARVFTEDLARMEVPVQAFSESLWRSMLDHATVYGKEDVRFTFKNGLEATP